MNSGVGQMIPFDSVWGHWAGGPGDSAEDVKWLDKKLEEFFDKEKIDEVEIIRGNFAGASLTAWE
jgi:homoserine O-acetyltransferase